MADVVQVVRGGSMRLLFELYTGAAGSSPRLDLSGRTLTVEDSNLPFTLSIEVVNLVLGQFYVTAADTVLARNAYEYSFRVEGAGAGLELYSTPRIPVVFS